MERAGIREELDTDSIMKNLAIAGIIALSSQVKGAKPPGYWQAENMVKRVQQPAKVKPGVKFKFILPAIRMSVLDEDLNEIRDISINGAIRIRKNELINSIGMKFAGVEYDSSQLWFGVYEVTNEEYEKVMGRISKDEPRRSPARMISWSDAVAFCDRLSQLPAEAQNSRIYRLPSEGEWEYACRAGTGTDFNVGNFLKNEDANFGGIIGRPTIVGMYPPNAFGLYDMHGNVLEWCAGTGIEKPLRGGDYSSKQEYCKSQTHFTMDPKWGMVNYGFRVVLEIKK